MHRIEAVVIDLDGVVVDKNGEIDPGVIKTINELDEANIATLSATSRSFHRSGGALARRLGLKTLGLFNGGALMANPATGHVVWEAALDKVTAYNLVQGLQPHATHINFGHGRQPASGINPYAIHAMNDSCHGIWVEIPDANMPEAGHIILSMPDVHHYSNHGTVAPGINGLHITPKGVNKFSGTRRLLRELGISPQNTVGIGDGDIDIPLLAAVGLGIAMGNATAALKRQADHVVGRVDEPGDRHGFVQAMRQYVINTVHGA